MALILKQGGFDEMSDGYFSAHAVLVYIFAIVGAITTRPLMPYLTGMKKHDVPAISVGVLIYASSVACILLVSILLFSESITRFILWGAGESRLNLTRELLDIMAWSAAPFALCSTFQAYGQYQGKFVKVELICIGSHIVSILTLLTVAAPIHAIGWSFLARYFVRAFLMAEMFPWKKIHLIECKQVWRLTKSFIVKTVVLIGSSSFYKLMGVLDVFVTSFLSEGSLSLIKTIQFIYSGLTTIFNRSYFTPFVRRLALEHNKLQRSFSASLAEKLPHIAILAGVSGISVSIGLSLLIKFEIIPSGNITQAQIITYSMVLAVSLIGDVWGNASTSLFYARGDMNTPTKVGIIGMIIAICHKYSLALWLGGGGIVVSAALHYLGNAVVLHSQLGKIRDDNTKI